MAKIDNQTDLPHSKVKGIVRWVLRELEVDLPALVVRVVRAKEKDRTLGRFYVNASQHWPIVWKQRGPHFVIPDEAEHLVVLRVPRTPQQQRVMRSGPPAYEVNDWRESLLCIAAHEAMHVRHELFPIPGRPRFSEVDAEWAEYRLLRRWREKGVGET